MFNNDFDNSWEDLRAEAHAFMKEKEENLIKNWLYKIGYKYKEPVGYYINICNNTMEIYSHRVGALIGKAGMNVDELKKMLSDEFHGEWKVKFTEIRGGFVELQNNDLGEKNNDKVILYGETFTEITDLLANNVKTANEQDKEKAKRIYLNWVKFSKLLQTEGMCGLKVEHTK